MRLLFLLNNGKVNSKPQTTVKTTNHKLPLVTHFFQVCFTKLIAVLIPTAARAVPAFLILIKCQII